MMMASMKKSRKKKAIKVQMLRRPNRQCRLPETSSVEETEAMTEPIGAEAKT